MCGRYSLTTPAELLAEIFSLDETPSLSPHWNIAPSQLSPVVVQRASARIVEEMRFGLTAREGGLQINARSETVDRLPSFRDAFRSRRCLVPADAFYEWRVVPGVRKKQPYVLRREDGRPFGMAGLWTPATSSSAPAFAILTTAPNSVVQRIHDRMPVILSPEAWATWLSSKADAATLAGLLGPAPDEGWTARPISTLVNDVKNDSPEVARPIF